jgi:hypothetical protein
MSLQLLCLALSFWPLLLWISPWRLFFSIGLSLFPFSSPRQPICLISPPVSLSLSPPHLPEYLRLSLSPSYLPVRLCMPISSFHVSQPVSPSHHYSSSSGFTSPPVSLHLSYAKPVSVPSCSHHLACLSLSLLISPPVDPSDLLACLYVSSPSLSLSLYPSTVSNSVHMPACLCLFLMLSDRLSLSLRLMMLSDRLSLSLRLISPHVSLSVSFARLSPSLSLSFAPLVSVPSCGHLPACFSLFVSSLYRPLPI